MTLIDILSIISEGDTVIIWKDGDPVSYYDGKESIDEHYNNETVKNIWAGEYKIHIVI